MKENGELTVSLEHIDDFEFRVRFERSGVKWLLDEPAPLGGGAGPNPHELLAGAIGNCLSSSLLFCLRKAKVEPRSLRTTVHSDLERNERGRMRVGSTRVEIHLDTEQPRERLKRCLELFEDYCIVTQSVRRGIDVELAVFDASGEELHRSGGVPVGMSA